MAVPDMSFLTFTRGSCGLLDGGEATTAKVNGSGAT
jgi:hypothetical protein